MAALGLDAPGWAPHKEFKSKQGLDPQDRLFVCHGTNCEVVRRLLLERGWVENTDTKSRAFDLKWTVRPKRVDGLVGCVSRSQLTNHFRGAGQLDSKSAIAANLGACPACCEKIFPRQYDLRKASALKAFLEDFLLSAAHATDLRERQESASHTADGGDKALDSPLEECDDSEDEPLGDDDEDDEAEDEDDEAGVPAVAAKSPRSKSLGRSSSSRRLRASTRSEDPEASDADALAAATAAATAPPPPPVGTEELQRRRHLLRGHATAVLRRASAAGRSLGARVVDGFAEAPVVRCCHDLEAVTGRSRCLPSWLDARFRYYVERYDAEARDAFAATAEPDDTTPLSQTSPPGASCPRCAISESATASCSSTAVAGHEPTAAGDDPRERMVAGPQHVAFDGNANVWILKAANLSRGRGISVYTDLRSLLEEAGLKHVHRRQTWCCVAQKYLERPLTLAGHKVDLRLWVLVTSWYPCVTWVFHEPYFRVASAALAFDAKSKNRRLQDRAHLTNRTQHNEDNRISLEEFFERLAANEDGPGSVEEARALYLARTWPQMLDGARAALLATQASAVSETEAYRARTRCRLDGPRTFEIFGFDFALDFQMRPWLLEANCSPDMIKEGPDWLLAWSEDAVNGLLDIVLNSHEGRFRFRAAEKCAHDAGDSSESPQHVGEEELIRDASEPAPPPVPPPVDTDPKEPMPPMEPRPLVERHNEVHASHDGLCYGARLAQVPEPLVRGMKVEGAGKWLLMLNEVETASKQQVERSRALADLCLSWTIRLSSSWVGPQNSAGHSQVLKDLLLPIDESLRPPAALGGYESRLRRVPSSGTLPLTRSRSTKALRGAANRVASTASSSAILRSRSEGPKAWVQSALTRLPAIITFPSSSSNGR